MKDPHVTTLTFTTDGRFFCDGLAPVLRAHGKHSLKPVRVGGGVQEGEIGCSSCPKFARCGLSHTAEVTSDIKDIYAIKEACRAMGLEAPVQREKVHFGGTVQSGICVQLPGWHYPVVIDLKSGSLKYDNYNGRWGENKHLDALKQQYGLAKATLIAKSRGYMYQKTTLANGAVKLQVMVP